MLLGGALIAACGTVPAIQTGAAEVSPVPGVSSASQEDGVQSVRLTDMEAARADPARGGRNPFRFGAAGTLERSPGQLDVDDPFETGLLRVDTPRSTRVPSRTGPPRAPDLPLTFIGFAESPGIEGRIVILTDGDFVYYGRRGEVIDGRYRIVGLGLESVDIEPIDGRGRQTLRLQTESSSGL